MGALGNLNEEARKIFSADTNIILARSPKWGNDDMCFLVYGADQILVATMLQNTLRNATVTQQCGGGWRGTPTYTYQVIEGIPV